MEISNGKMTLTDITTSSEKNGHSKKRRFWHINKAMLPYKLHYFLFIGSLGAVMPYQSAIGITRFGLTAGNLAVSYTSQQFIFILSNPCIGYLADYFNKLKAFIIGLTIFQTLFFLFLIVIPSTGVRNIPQNKSISSLNDTLPCELCNFYDNFSSVSTMQSIDDNELRKVFSCYEKINSSVVKCSNPTNFDSIIINILYSICDSSAIEETVLTVFSDLHAPAVSNVLFTVVSFNGSRNVSNVCVSPEHFSILKTSTSHDIVKKYCRSISDSITLKQMEQFDNTHFEVTRCGNFSENIFLEDESSLATTSDNFKTYRFWLFTLCVVSSSICVVSLFTISDTACYESVQGVDFGRQRSWGAISWGLMAPFGGFLNDYTQGYVASWFLMASFSCLQIWNLSRMNLVKPNLSDNILKDVKKVFKSTEFLAFEVGVLMNGMFTGVVWFYMTWFLMTIGGNKLVIGLLHAVECFLGEVPIMIVSGWMIKKFGHFNLVSLALLSHGIRFFVYSYIHNPWWILPVECLHGFSYGSFIPAMTSYGKLNAKPGTETTTQAILSITFDAIGAGVGCVIVGIFFDLYGAHTTFFFASFICLFATFINVVFTVIFRCRKQDLVVTEIDLNKK